jgi:hypothetical protein
MTTLVDDRALSELLRGERTVDGAVHTTGLWYVRLCQAVLASNRFGTGQLSGPIASLPPSAQRAAIRALISLPEPIGLASLRELGPTIAELRQRHSHLNLLSIEALAAARQLDATVLLTTSSPRLQEALELEGLDVRLDR